MHTITRSAQTHLPTGHSVQLAADPKLYVPIGQGPEQETLVVGAEPNSPGAHAMHTSTAKYLPAEQPTFSTSVTFRMDDPTTRKSTSPSFSWRIEGTAHAKGSG